MNTRDISQKIKEVRKTLRFTQQEMADILGIKRTSYAHIELGTTLLTFDQFIKVVTQYNINVEWFIWGKGDVFNTNINPTSTQQSTYGIEKEQGFLTQQLTLLQTQLSRKDEQIAFLQNLLTKKDEQVTSLQNQLNK